MNKIKTHEEIVKMAKLIKAEFCEIYNDSESYREFRFKWINKSRD